MLSEYEGVTKTAPNEIILTFAQFRVLLDAAEAALDTPGDWGELDRVLTEIRERLDRSCVVYPFPRKQADES
jgi:hypothetical protein